MSFKKALLPILIVATAIGGLGYRKFLWCNILLPAPGEPKGAGDLVEIIPVALMLLFCAISLVVGTICLFVKKYKNKKFGVFLIMLSTLSIPIYLAIHSILKPICNSP